MRAAGAAEEEEAMKRSAREQRLLDTLFEIRDRCWGQQDHRYAPCCLAACDADRAINEFERDELLTTSETVA